jgi:heme-degrading monooxygenase HmoA
VITEQAVLDVRPGRESEFEMAFAEAKTIIVSMPGFQSLQLHRCIERSNRYLLLVTWERLEGHTDGFRKSARHEEWSRLLRHLYDPFPALEHFGLVAHV